jgi:DNA-directed RNA polymerase subunit E'/Rpb7
MTSRENIYSKSILIKRINIPIKNINKKIDELLKKKIVDAYEGRCVSEGFIKKNSYKFISKSCGVISGNTINIDVIFECELCLPVEGMTYKCIIRNKTKAGIRAEIDEDNSPVIIFIARDHHNNNQTFLKANEGDTINVTVIGQRYELNDKYISVIGEIKNGDILQPRLSIN